MEPIPLSLIQAGRELTEPRISPDGQSVAFVQRWRGAASINLVPLGGDGFERQLTFGPDPAPGRGLGGGCFTWVDSTNGAPSIVYVARDGELWWQDGTQLVQLTDHGRSVRGPAVAPGAVEPPGGQPVHAPALVAYAVDEAEIWLLDLDTRVSERLDDGRHEFCFDPSLGPAGHRVSWQAWNPPDMPWDGAVRVDLDRSTGAIAELRIPDGAVQQPRFTAFGARLHVHDASGWLNVYVDDEPIVEEPVEHAGPTWGMGNRSYALDPSAERVAFTRNEAGHGALCVADLGADEVVQIGRGVHGHLDWNGEHLVALRSGARTPPQVVVYSGPRHERRTLVHSQPDVWVTNELPEPEIIECSARDGVVLHARRFVAGQGRVLCWVHGGPTDQWQVEWRPRFVYWWSRGWDVLVVDPRGTTGHGRAFQQGLHGKWGRADVDDTADLLEHVHREGWASPATTVAIGGSSGGLTVLGVLADHGHLVCGGVASYPVSDLAALADATHRFEAHYTDTLVAPNDGSDRTNQRFRELSPISRADQVAVPLLLFHGTDDPVVPKAQSDVLAARVRDAGGDVTYIVYDGEGHGFRDPVNVADEYARTEAFLEHVAGS